MTENKVLTRFFLYYVPRNIPGSFGSWRNARLFYNYGCVRLTLFRNKGPCKRWQHCWSQHVASVCTPCCVLLRLVGSCWMKFETGQTSEPPSASISIVSRSSKRGPTMLRSFAQHIQQRCAGARALHATYPHKYMRTRNQHGVGDGKRPRVLCIFI